MEHDEAIRSQCAERYVAGELSPGERDLFEEHFFECAECAEEVRWGQIFAANARAVAREVPAGAPLRKPFEWWGAWLPRPALALSLAANIVLIAGFGWSVLTRASVPGPRFVPAYFAPPPSRGAQEPRTVPAGATAIAVHFPVPDRTYASYSYEILDATGSRAASGTVPAPATSEDELYLIIPVSGLSAGDHVLAVRGAQSADIVARLRLRISR